MDCNTLDYLLSIHNAAEVVDFPPHFLFGTANADHQVEAYDPDYPDVWDLWEKTQQRTPRGRASDFWNLYHEDIARAAALGIKIFRFSIAWSRVQPSPTTWNAEAIDHYRQLCECIREHGMQVMATFVHFTWPIWLEKEGGLIGERFVEYFTAYTKRMAKEIGSLVHYWITFNEPSQLVYGYIKPWWQLRYYMPPGLPAGTGPTGEALAVGKLIKNLFVGHARARLEIKQHDSDSQVGINPLVTGFPPWLQNVLDRQFFSQSLLEAMYCYSVARPLVTERARIDLVLGGLRAETQPTLLFSQPYHLGPDEEDPDDDHCVFVPAHHKGLLLLVDSVIAEFNEQHIPHEQTDHPSAQVPISLADYFASEAESGPRKLLMDEGLRRIKNRGVLTVGIREDAPGMCESCPEAGLEMELAHRIAEAIFKAHDRVEFVKLDPKSRPKALTTKASPLNKAWRFFGAATLIANANWWYLGSRGKLPSELCPEEAQGAHDFVGFDYYWGLPTKRLHEFYRLVEAAEGRFVNAPVWPEGLGHTLDRFHRWFPDQKLMIIENGSVPFADRTLRADYLKAHLQQVADALSRRVPVSAYLYWSLTSNREWGHSFTKQTDFGLYHVNLDGDSNLPREPTSEVALYQKIVQSRSLS